MFRVIWTVIGIVFVNLVFVLGPFLGLLGLLGAGWICGIAGILSPLIMFVSAIAIPGTFEWFDVFVSIEFCGIGLFISIGMYYATKGVKKGFLRYLEYNAAIVKGGIKRD
ncbi:HAAS domain-containing protein [Bacillus methanolicus]|uniref:Putative membrane protein n=1 Tax=Bacillus methanolicus (strain MGA3 / ATCC 53907) TaxID=796606 RepID=I3E972_BACMM|nr:DUF1700 domain-containing protein [Bacillus methanolicus]AIE60298.1 putative membrane protein [Bacillus methanolicus MGA3]EIJ83043.1 hypothetical protein MGA3_07465 [Bacillus methanolicus MGA3]